jgi:hypothetical protein
LRATRTMVFMQGTITVQDETIARVSGIFKIGQAVDFGQLQPSST